MKFSDAVRMILSASKGPLTPQEIRSTIKKAYPDFFGTPSQIRNVNKGHYKDLDHALLAQIYTLIRSSQQFICDTTNKPMKVTLQKSETRQWPEKKMLESQKTRYVPHSTRKNQYGIKVKDILKNADDYHHAYYQANVFSGPSFYFHKRALETRNNPSSLTNIENIYATLSTWGMHRLGKRGSKMHNFNTFRLSIENLKENIIDAQKYNYQELKDEQWACLEEIFIGIKVMASRSSLVGNSKVMHHILPHIIPPIDRQYTLWFLKGNKSLKNDLVYEWKLMKEIIIDFFLPISRNDDFLFKANRWIERKDEFYWDTSILKVIDNLVIGSQK